MPQHAPEFDSGWVGAGPDDDLDERMAQEDEAWDRAQPRVVTVLGPVSPAALGPVLAGEPLMLFAGDGDAGEPFGPGGHHALRAELEDAYASGVRTIVAAPADLTAAPGDVLVWLAGRTQAHLVRLARWDGVLAGVASLPDGWGGVAVSARNRTSVEAAARWSAAAACPLRVLAEDALDGARAAEWAAAAGAAPDRLSIGGRGWRTDPSAAKAALGSGASIVLAPGNATDAASFAHGVARLVDAGHGERLLLTAGLGRRADLLANGGARGLGWTMERIPLALMDAGLDALAVRRILVDNPARTLTIGPGE